MEYIADWHTHNYRCNHAKGNIIDYIRSAIKKDIKIIGLSDHFPTHYSNDDNSLRLKKFAMDIEEVTNYLLEAEYLRKVFEDQIKIKIGFEMGYLEGKEDKYFNRIQNLKNNIDHLIGSVHTIKLNNKYWGIKNGDLKYLINKYGSKKIYSQYFKTVKNMLFSDNFDFDIIGHLDYIKNGRENSKLNDFILEEIYKLVPFIKKRGIAVEINTQGLRNGYKKLYPCKRILKFLYDNDIPIVLSSDAHDPLDVGFGFKKVLNLIKKIGNMSIVRFNKRKMLYSNLN